MALHIVDEANRCLNCKKPLCQKGCPISTEIPTIIQLFKENKLIAAGEKLFENNPMSVICAAVCDHHAQCAGSCILGKKSNPVQFYEIEKFISDAYLDRMPKPNIQKNGKTVAVIGAGPAGMTVAIILAQAGYGVTIFEELDRIGGMTMYGIPEFRLPKTVLVRYKKLMLKLGIQFRPNTPIGTALTIEDLFRDGYASVFVGTGVWRPRTLGIKGECLANVHYGISYLSNPTAYDLGETVAVIGMGNVAMDVARTAFRNGAQRVILFARGKGITASPHELEYAQLDGAEFVFERAIESITPEGPIFRPSILDDEDHVIGYEDRWELVKADSTIIAVSQGPRDKLVRTTHSLERSDKGLLIVDENCMTTRPGVFAAGDVVNGPKTVVHSVAQAKLAAQSMIAYMEGK